MDYRIRIIRKPLDFTVNTRSNCGVKALQLVVSSLLLFRPGRTWEVACFPRLELARPVLATSDAQFGENFWILRR